MTLKLIVPMMKDSRLLAEVAAHRFPLLFATVSGAHLYGFPSPDSDYDLRGAHVAPVSVLAGRSRRGGSSRCSTFFEFSFPVCT